jgi:hypothetical protein
MLNQHNNTLVVLRTDITVEIIFRHNQVFHRNLLQAKGVRFQTKDVGAL